MQRVIHFSKPSEGMQGSGPEWYQSGGEGNNNFSKTSISVI
jgi:hypothetical protein